MTSLSFEEYKKMPDSKRVAYLSDRVQFDVPPPEHFLLQALPYEQAILAKWQIIKALGICKSIDGISLLIQACKEPEVDFGSTSLHAICAWSLGQIGHSAFLPVISLLSEANAETRRCAIDALGEINDPRGVKALCYAIEHDEYKVQLYAGLSLAKIGNKSLPYLHQILSRTELAVRLILLDAIIKISSEKSIPILKQLLDGESIEEKKFILLAAQSFHRALLREIKVIAKSSDVHLSELASRAIHNLQEKVN